MSSEVCVCVCVHVYMHLRIPKTINNTEAVIPAREKTSESQRHSPE